MTQPSIASFFHSRKRAATDDLFNAKNKIFAGQKGDNLASGVSNANKILENEGASSEKTELHNNRKAKITYENATPGSAQEQVPKSRKITTASKPRRCLKRATTSDAQKLITQPKIVKFTLGGNLSPKKKISSHDKATDKPATVAVVLFGAKETVSNINRGMKTPTKEEQIARATIEKQNTVRNNLTLEEIKTKVTKSSRLSELKASLSKLQTLEEARVKLLNTKSRNATTDKHSISDQQSDRAALILAKGLKQFGTIDLEVLSSPQKGLTTPTKLLQPPSPSAAGNNDLMSPKKTATPRRLFSPIKSIESPLKAAGTGNSNIVPAYQRFQNLAEAGRPTLQMPYKYRCLSETFKCLDTVCAMFFNRHETITMKKLKPAVQRMLRKNFSESSLAQIKCVYPDAYKFHQKKMLNAGSHTKYDYYQLVITPNVEVKNDAAETKLNEDNIIRSGQEKTMNPQVMIERQKNFNNLLLDVVKDVHDKFLRALVPPIILPKEKINRWHAEFDLQNCPDIEKAVLPLPPNVEKFSSAKDILSTARNLFNCSTPMERVMQRFEAKQQEKQEAKAKKAPTNTETDTESEPSTPTTCESKPVDAVSAILKGVPKSLLERIRAKQAAKALDAMTRRPSQDKEAEKYERLPELARYLRNIFVTESKSVLELETVISKIENSFRERMTKDTLKELLQLMGREAPNNWLTFHFIRKTDFVKIKKDVDLNEIIKVLEKKAIEAR